MHRFAPGDSVVWRSVDRKERIVQTVWPWTVVTDDEDETVFTSRPARWANDVPANEAVRGIASSCGGAAVTPT